MGRRSLDATKLLWSLIVRAAVAFFRGACLLAVDFFLAADGELAVLFLLAADLLLCDELGDEVDDEVEVCAGNPLPCSSNSMARPDEVRRLRNIGGLSLTRLFPESVPPKL